MARSKKRISGKPIPLPGNDGAGVQKGGPRVGAKPARKEKVPKSCANCSRWKEVKRQMGIARILGNAVKQFESKLGDADFTPTVAEYLKLVQMEHEYEKELNPPEEIRVTWIEPTTESENSK